MLPTLWFRNTWSDGTQPRPSLKRIDDLTDATVVRADSDGLGPHFLYAADRPATLFCDNETNTARLFGEPNATRYVKDGIGEAVVSGDQRGRPSDGSGDQGGCSLCDRCGGGSNGKPHVAPHRHRPGVAQRERRSLRPAIRGARRPTPTRSRCVLCRPDSGVAERRRDPCDAPGTLRSAVDQAVLRLRRHEVARASTVSRAERHSVVRRCATPHGSTW